MVEVVDQKIADDYAIYCGDSAEIMKGIPENTIHLSLYSPPFQNLYVYSPTERDVGNCKNTEEFFLHYGFIIDELLRVTMPGRNTCVHVSQVPAMLVRDGYIGLKDFRGKTIQAYEDHGWIYHGEVCIDKNPQPLIDGTPVLTPQGWTPIESLRVGDLVIGGDGVPTEVVAIPYQGNQPMYQLTFDDGATIDCAPSHKWQVRTSSINLWHHLSTEQIAAEGSLTPKGRYRYAVPITLPVEFAGNQKLPVHPKLLGAFLADGSWSSDRSIDITKDSVLIEALPLPPKHTFVKREGSERANGRTSCYGITCETWHKNDVLDGLRQLGLQQCRAWEKFIPDMYLFASINDRRELLQGLLDGDGRISPKGGIDYRTTSERLAHNVVHLVNSLGGLATARVAPGNKYDKGTKQGKPLWTICIRITGDWCPFSLERKARRWKPNRRNITRKIISIELVGKEAPCTCITVANNDGLFVADHFIVTHNSQAIRTHSKALLFAQLRKDASWLRPALADYILLFRKPGDNAAPIVPDLTNNEWIEWAHPVWYGIRESDTLNVGEARENDDERHICPLQLGTIERCIRLWSNSGDTVLSPFMGIGSEGYVALQHGRKFIGIELKESYFNTAARNLQSLRSGFEQASLLEGDWNE
jgi:hypothetical protein